MFLTGTTMTNTNYTKPQLAGDSTSSENHFFFIPRQILQLIMTYAKSQDVRTR